MDYEPLEIGKRFRIVPPDTTPLTDKTDIVMARGAFGSGEHETTASCIEIMEDLDLTNQRFLDLGSGTAILAITALKLGAASGVCVDIEEDAVASARLNCELNGISEEIDHLCGTLDDVEESGFDFILANIYGDILLAVCNALVSKLQPGGILLLSGILWEYDFPVRQKYERAGCEVIRSRMMEEFCTVLLKKKNK